MGAYGTPDTYPYEETERKCPHCGRQSKGRFCCYCGASLEGAKAKKEVRRDGEKGYRSIFGGLVLFFSIAMFAFLFFFGEKTLKEFSIALFAGAGVSAVGNCIGMILCILSKTKNKWYRKAFFCSLAVCVLSFILFCSV